MTKAEIIAELEERGIPHNPRSLKATLREKLERADGDRRLTATTPESPKVTAPTFDSKGGEVNIWPILAADAQTLAAEIEAGDHDDYISLLGHVDRSQHDGRPLVQEAIRKRMGR